MHLPSSLRCLFGPVSPRTPRPPPVAVRLPDSALGISLVGSPEMHPGSPSGTLLWNAGQS